MFWVLLLWEYCPGCWGLVLVLGDAKLLTLSQRPQVFTGGLLPSLVFLVFGEQGGAWWLTLILGSFGLALETVLHVLGLCPLAL